MSLTRIAAAITLLAATPAVADDAKVEGRTERKPETFDIRLTLSSFLFRQTGDDGDPIVADGAPVQNASPVRRYFGDLRIEMAEDNLQFDGRIRQTTSERYQSGAGGGSEYELRTLTYRLEGERNKLVLGRQYVDAVGLTKVDGGAFVRKLTPTWSGTLFGGAYPALGSRSLDTDYPSITKEDGSAGAPLVPIVGGLGVGYRQPTVHGDLGLAAVYVAQDVPLASRSEASRVFTTASGYARPVRWLNAYHFALLDVAGGGGVNLTNGSLGLDMRAASNVQVTLAVHHVSTDLLQIAARNVLEDPDPNAGGLVQNGIAIIRVSQDTARLGTSVALAQQRFEVSVSGSYHRRPGVDVALTDGGVVSFPEARSVDTSLTLLDRKSIAGLRTSATAALTYPISDVAPNQSRSAIVRVATGRAVLDDRIEFIADVALARFRNSSGSSPTGCMDSSDVFQCFSISKSTVVEGGALASYRIAREWLFLLDGHVGVQDARASTLMGTLDYPHVLSFTMFARAQWRYR
jgi:hypothetical protein